MRFFLILDSVSFDKELSFFVLLLLDLLFLLLDAFVTVASSSAACAFDSSVTPVVRLDPRECPPVVIDVEFVAPLEEDAEVADEVAACGDTGGRPCFEAVTFSEELLVAAVTVLLPPLLRVDDASRERDEDVDEVDEDAFVSLLEPVFVDVVVADAELVAFRVAFCSACSRSFVKSFVAL